MAFNWSSFTIYYIYLTKLDSLSFLLVRFILFHYSIIHMTTDQNVSNVQTLFWQFELGRTLMFVFIMKLFCFTHSLIHLSLKVDHNNRVFRNSNGKMELDFPDVFDINCCVLSASWGPINIFNGKDPLWKQAKEQKAKQKLEWLKLHCTNLSRKCRHRCCILPWQSYSNYFWGLLSFYFLPMHILGLL